MRQTVFVAAAIVFGSSPALAEVKIGGIVNAGAWKSWSSDGVEGTTNRITTSNQQDLDRYKEGFSKEGISATNSRISFNADTDVTNWLKVVFQYELDISDTGAAIGNGTFALRSRNSFAGISTTWGALKVGTNEHLYEKYLYEADPIDNASGLGGNLQVFGSPGYGVVFDIGQQGIDPQKGQAGFYRRTDQSIWYESPDLSGFTFGAAISLNAYQRDAENQPYKSRVWSVGAQYKPEFFPFYVNVAYERHIDLFGLAIIAGNPNGGKTTSDTGMKAQAGVTLFSRLTVGAIVEYLEYTAEEATNIAEYSRLAFGGHAKLQLPFAYIGVGAGMAQDGKFKDTSDVTGTALDSGGRYLGLGYFHKLNDEAEVHLKGTVLQNKASASFALPSGATPSLNIAGADHTAFYLGIKYSF